MIARAGCDASPSVPWSDHAPTVKRRIDQLATAKDCSGLQGQFDIAGNKNESTMSRIGHNNVQGSERGRGGVADVVVGVSLGRSSAHRQHLLRPIEGWGLRLVI